MGFYKNEVPNFTAKELLDLISWPTDLLEGLNDEVSVNNIKSNIELFRNKTLKRLGKFYEENQELYTCYKHGHRIAPFVAKNVENKKPNAVLYYYKRDGTVGCIIANERWRKYDSEIFTIGFGVLRTFLYLRCYKEIFSRSISR